jgi:Mg-chelatase subunit ChlD
MSVPIKMRSDERGSVQIIFLLVLTFVLLPLIGLAVDSARLFVIKAKLTTAVDAAALAAGRSLSVGEDLASQKDAAIATGQAYFKANFPDNYWNATPSAAITVDQTKFKVRTINVQAQAIVPLIFMQAVGFQTTIVAASGQASRRDLNVILTLDRSGSMANSKSCDPMKAAAQSFVGKFSNGRDTLGLITFMQSANVDYAPTTNFNTQNPTLSSVIGTIACTDSTATAEALSLAYNQIKIINQPGSLNVIVLFTDGLPNGVTANYPMKTTSTCQAGTPLIGSVSDGSPTAGIYDNTNKVGPSKSPPGLIAAPGCSFAKNANQVSQDVEYIPDTDLYGNSTFGYRSTPTYVSGPGAGHIRIDQTSTIDDASINAADNAATKIRNDATYQTIIYTLGYSSSVDKTFLLRVANDPASPIYDSTRAAGKFVFAPDQSALGTAFNAIASEILRLSQ